MVLEGVRYSAFLVTFTTDRGKERTATVHAPGPPLASNPWLHEIVCRYLDGRGDVDATKKIVVRRKS